MNKKEIDKEIKEAESFTLEDMKKEREIEDKWEKKHPILTWLRKKWWYINPFGSYNLYSDIKGFFKDNWFFLFHGFYPRDWWGFYTYHAKRNAKILRYYYKHTISHKTQPKEQKEYFEAVKEIIKGFDLIVEDDYDYIPSKKMRDKLIKCDPKLFSHKKFKKSEKNYKQIQKSLKLFVKYYFHMWD